MFDRGSQLTIASSSLERFSQTEFPWQKRRRSSWGILPASLARDITVPTLDRLGERLAFAVDENRLGKQVFISSFIIYESTSVRDRTISDEVGLGGVV